ncbi:MAG: tRNA lysidine(34) synthetase TilS [Bacteroidales bacterium]|jgi:tRNA(Ile)-lysidine synthase|nr:tRNA lysidine(34) synthetase TilS [Bacteroidales bacterium]
MDERFVQQLQELCPNLSGSKFLLAVSGGKDSRVLLHLFATATLQFDIAHCNFHLRGEASNEDEQFVRALAIQYQCNCYVRAFYAADFAACEGESIEMAARTLRYRWFEDIGQNYDYVVTAHHANDNAETLLLNLCRGCGLKGTTGIPARNGKILRPLLNFTAKEIDAYSADNCLHYRVDQSNRDTRFRRNKIRHEVLPLLSEINPKVIEVFHRNIEILSRQYRFYKQHIQTKITNLCKETPRGIEINLEILSKEDDPLLLLYEILSIYGFGKEIAQQIDNNLDARIAGRHFYSRTHIALQDRGILTIYPLIDKATGYYTIHNPEMLQSLGFAIQYIPYTNREIYERDGNVFYADANKLSFPLLLRHWQPGDIFYPFGMKQRQKLSDFFINQKINVIEKQKVWLLCRGQNIAWVVGHRADNRFKIDSQTKYYYKIKYHGIL